VGPSDRFCHACALTEPVHLPICVRRESELDHLIGGRPDRCPGSQIIRAASVVSKARVVCSLVRPLHVPQQLLVLSRRRSGLVERRSGRSSDSRCSGSRSCSNSSRSYSSSSRTSSRSSWTAYTALRAGWAASADQICCAINRSRALVLLATPGADGRSAAATAAAEMTPGNGRTPPSRPPSDGKANLVDLPAEEAKSADGPPCVPRPGRSSKSLAYFRTH